MKKLVLTEKPSVAREIARVLGCNQKSQGALIGSQYVITWALGHLVTLALPEELKSEWTEWQLETLPMIPDVFETRVIKETSKQFGVVKSWLKNPEISELIIATDAGREGELVARWIINKTNFHKPMKRLWISSMTDMAIRTGFNHLCDASKYDSLFDSAESRAIADWLVGLNVTRALTCKYNAQLSAGRVQTPTLAFITKREEEIRKFVPRKYETIQLLVKGTIFTLQDEHGEKRYFDHEEAIKVLNDLNKGNFKVTNIKEVLKEELPPLLYDLTSLQQDGNRLYGFSAKKTLDIIQRLYENEKYLTYPRTDSKYLSSDMYTTIKERLLVIATSQYGNEVKEILSKPLNNSKRIFNSELVTDHHAIITTEQKTNLPLLEPDTRRIYDLVVKRFLAAFLSNHQFKKTTITISTDINHLQYNFTVSGKVITNLGWKKVYQKNEVEDDEVTNTLPIFNLNEQIKPNLSLKQGLTNPPSRYTEATLLGAMEHPEQFVTSSSSKKTLIETSGIGTPATRAEIIERIFSAHYVELKGKTIYPTEKGMQLVKLVPNELCSPELTATWEDRLNQIKDRKADKKQFINDMETNTRKLITEVIGSSNQYHHDNLVQTKCPVCGKNLLEVSNKNGKMLVCMDRTCGYKKPLSRNTNLQCPNCHKRLIKIGEDEKSFYQCSCGFKEKVNAFHEKRKGNNGVNKKAVDSYLKGKDNVEPSNNPFAELFKK